LTNLTHYMFIYLIKIYLQNIVPIMQFKAIVYKVAAYQNTVVKLL